MEFNKELFMENLMIISGQKKKKDIAADLGIDPTAISKWKSGAQSPTVDQLILISEKYNCSINDLLGIESDITAKSFSEILRSVFIFDMMGKDFNENTQPLTFEVAEDEKRNDLVGMIKIHSDSSESLSCHFVSMISEYKEVRKAFEYIEDTNIKTNIIDDLIEKHTQHPDFVISDILNNLPSE